MSVSGAFIKRTFDLFFSAFGLIALWPLILFLWLLASIETRSNGLFMQVRVGHHGKFFKIIKIKTMLDGSKTTITSAANFKITRFGSIMRNYKLDELPQLINILVGDMSFVGPRPDVPGYADKLTNGSRRILAIRPGVTGFASIYFRNEQKLLASVKDPQHYNDHVIWPKKVALNLEYIDTWSFFTDIKIIWHTLFP